MSHFSHTQLLELLYALKSFSDPSHSLGITRLAYGKEDEQAHQFILQRLQQMGLQMRQDAMGNIYARLPGKKPELPAVATGSHLDSVPQGGMYDGPVGVCVGLYAILQHQPGQLLRSLELVIFRAEESSRFGFSCIASKVLTGQVEREKWQKNKDRDGLDLFQALEQAGYDPHPVANNQLQLAKDAFSAFIEVHIEQGKCLEHANKSIGIVTGIAAPTRFRVYVSGHADHSGATPMSQRHDALVASAEIIRDLHLAACKESCHGTVGTVGKLDVEPNSMNVIPGHVLFFVDIRGVEADSIQRVVDQFQASVKKAAFMQQVEISIDEISCEQPVTLNPAVCQVLENACQQQQIPHMRMISGAGHDAMNIARLCPTAMLFIPSRDGISHHHAEFSSDEDILLAADVLAQALQQLANQEI